MNHNEEIDKAKQLIQDFIELECLWRNAYLGIKINEIEFKIMHAQFNLKWHID